MTEPFIPFAVADLGVEEREAVVETLQSGWITSGPRTAEFEEAFKAYTGAQRALAVNSCTAGLHLALAALEIGPGDEVITTPLTFCATVNVILERGATPVLADIGDDFNLDPAAAAKLVTSRTRAIVPVHMAGLPCNMSSIRALALAHGLHVIEDAAHAVGARYRDVAIGGGSSDAVAFSFYATKNLTTGEGGMVTTASPELYERMKILCLHGISRDAWHRYTEKGKWFYEVVDIGYKYNLSDIMSAIGIQQLMKLERMNGRRTEIAAAFTNAFADVEELECPPDRLDSVHAWHLYILRLNLDRLSIDRAEFIEEMRQRGIGCSVHFIPLPLHPCYKQRLELRDPCSRALSEYPRLVSLPIYSRLTDQEVARVVTAVKDIVWRHKTKVLVPAEVAAAE